MTPTFDMTINVPSAVAVLVFIGGIIAGWQKFGVRQTVLEYRVDGIDGTLKILSETLKSIAETDKKIALIDQRQLSLETSHSALLEAVEGLRRGEGYIVNRRSNLDGEYSR
jgi:hypothetical protein